MLVTCFTFLGADNLAANFSRELADYIIYIIDVSAGDKIPRKGGPGITQADLLVFNTYVILGVSTFINLARVSFQSKCKINNILVYILDYRL